MTKLFTPHDPQPATGAQPKPGSSTAQPAPPAGYEFDSSFWTKFAPEFARIPDFINEAAGLDIDELRSAARDIWGNGDGQQLVAGAFDEIRTSFTNAPKTIDLRWQGAAFNAFESYAGKVATSAGNAAAAARQVGAALNGYADALAVSWGDLTALGIGVIGAIVGAVAGTVAGPMGTFAGAVVGFLAAGGGISRDGWKRDTGDVTR